jgi:hypothetical protein
VAKKFQTRLLPSKFKWQFTFCGVSNVRSIIYRILRHISSRRGCGRATEKKPLCPGRTTTYSQLRNLTIFAVVSVFIYCFICLFSLIVSSTVTHNVRETVKEMEKQERSRRRWYDILYDIWYI